MVKYVLKRIGYSIVTLFVLVTLTFFMQRLLPGDPFIGDKNLPEATMQALYAKYGLDKPLWMQYFMYLGNCLHGDLGISLQTNRAVTTIIGESFVVSFDVGMRAIIFALVLGVLLGTVAAIKRGSPYRYPVHVHRPGGCFRSQLHRSFCFAIFSGVPANPKRGHGHLRHHRLG